MRPVNPESGQAAVESALTLPLAIFLALGLIQLFMMFQGRAMAQYADGVELPLTDEVSTIEPPPAASIPGSTCLQPSTPPRRLTAMTWSNTSSS